MKSQHYPNSLIQYENEKNLPFSIGLRETTCRLLLVQCLTFILWDSLQEWKLARLFHTWLLLGSIIFCQTWSILSFPDFQLGVHEIESKGLSCHAGDWDLIYPSHIWLLTYLRRTKFTILVSFEDLFHKVNTYLEIKQNKSGLLLLNFAIIWHGKSISKRPFLQKQFQWWLEVDSFT